MKYKVISIQLLLLFIGIGLAPIGHSVNFNTTLVTVYPDKSMDLNDPELFQYNSCYCLSELLQKNNTTKTISIQLLLLFIQRFYAVSCFYYSQFS